MKSSKTKKTQTTKTPGHTRVDFKQSLVRFFNINAPKKTKMRRVLSKMLNSPQLANVLRKTCLTACLSRPLKSNSTKIWNG